MDKNRVKSLHLEEVNRYTDKIIKVKLRVIILLIRNQKLGIMKLEIYASNILKK